MQATPLTNCAKKVARSLVPRAARNWLRSPSASAKWIWDGVKFCIGIKNVIEMRPGWSLACHPAAYRCAYYAQQNDAEQIAEFDGFINNTSSGMTLFDVGAHFGLFSLAALHYGGPTARAVAVDPSPVAVNVLNVQAKLNHAADRLRVIQAAVSDRVGSQSMLAVGVLASGCFVAPVEGYPASELSQTISITLDSMVDELRVNPTHIKIDVEGYEAAVLARGNKTLSQASASILFLEIHNEIVSRQGRTRKRRLFCCETTDTTRSLQTISQSMATKF
ncbi:MAG TPA: FkbM family methyltransferase [Pyrinomonadaceae bacterium]